MIVAIDGPAGAGKSTVAKLTAQKLGFLYIDTGAMYRALTLKILQNKINIRGEDKIIATARKTGIRLEKKPDGSLKVFLDGIDVTREIRQPIITQFVSDIARIGGVRQLMVKLQRELGKNNDAVIDGRDIGTVVFVDAKKKFFLDADFSTRVNRRYKELRESGQEISHEEVASDLKNRDMIDSTREVGPLKKAEDAIYLDTTNMSIEEVVYKILSHLSEKNG